MNDEVARSGSEKTTKPQKRIHNSFARKIVVAALGIIFVLLVLHLSLQYLNLIVFDEKHGAIFELSNRFDFDDESSLPTWVSQVLFLAVGATAFFASVITKDVSRKKLWAIIGSLGVFVSLDEVIALHETLLQLLHTRFFG